MSETTSVSMVHRLQAGNQTRSWHQFFEFYEPFIQRWLTHQRLPESDAEDIRQEVMCTVLHEISNFRHNGSVGAFRCWLRMITVNQLRRYRRRRRDQSGVDLEWLAASLASSDHEIHRQFDIEHDRYLLTRLLEFVVTDFSSSTIDAFRMTALEGRSPADVADRLGITKAAVIAGRSRVLCRLRESAATLFVED
ncbi:sigma-70 family RNA polymerase sigma factor [Stieleria sp. ICT_E10.1]|uniref:sigma-70 family RNA polymerase sigma factor n=1 Tax=Stieleria sedimenti TaxID=2976331 RepID=UPI00217F8161|nr:sigma-70 family RNA polymerase sigma factor [Stieleria sedimenti]MCS7468705.1 sigma-70 family RNA polymerase sigma factor [Stieleria sedimenti]